MKAVLSALPALLTLLVACRVEQPVFYVAASTTASGYPATPTSAVVLAPEVAAPCLPNVARQHLPQASLTAQRHNLRMPPRAAFYRPIRHVTPPAASHPRWGDNGPMNPIRGLIISGAGLAAGSLLATPTTFGSVLVVGGLFGIGVSFALFGLGYCLLALYDNGRIARANRASQ